MTRTTVSTDDERDHWRSACHPTLTGPQGTSYSATLNDNGVDVNRFRRFRLGGTNPITARDDVRGGDRDIQRLSPARRQSDQRRSRSRIPACTALTRRRGRRCGTPFTFTSWSGGLSAFHRERRLRELARDIRRFGTAMVEPFFFCLYYKSSRDRPSCASKLWTTGRFRAAPPRARHNPTRLPPMTVKLQNDPRTDWHVSAEHAG